MTPRPGPRRWRLALGVAVTALAALGVLLGTAGPAVAHAELIGTDPADGAVLERAPEEVVLTFNEPVRLTERQVTVYDAEGDIAPSVATTSGAEVVVRLSDPATVERGTYVLAWFVLSGDGHPISGSLSFSVGERSAEVAEPPAPPTSSAVVTAVRGVLTAVHYLGLLLATGLAVFLVSVLPETYAGERVRGRVRRVLLAAADTGIVAAALLVPVSAAAAQGEELSDLAGGFDPGLVPDEIASAVMVLVGLGLIAVLATDRVPTPRRSSLVLGAVVIALAAPPTAGHTRSYHPNDVLLLADLAHVGAAAVWLGGLVGLVLALRTMAGREQLAAHTLARFSTIAGGSLLAVAAAGAVLGWRILGSWGAFLSTDYGVLLLVKIGLAVVVAVLGGWNRFVLLPRVSAAAGFADRTRSTGPVSRVMAVEASVLVVLLGVTGFLVDRSPRPEPVVVPPGQAGVEQSTVGELEVLATLSPRRQGSNTLLVQVQDVSGEPVTLRRPPEVTVRSGEVDLGEVALAGTDVGTYTARVVLPRPGTWEVQVGLRLSRFDRPVTTLPFEVTPEE